MPDLTRDTGGPASTPPPDSPIADDGEPSGGSSKKLIVRFSPSTAKLPPSSEDDEQQPPKTTASLSQRVERSSSSSCAGSEENTRNRIPAPPANRGNSGVLRSRSYGDTSELESRYQGAANHHHHRDNEDRCSTCSSSSSDDEDPYELPPRRAYGGVRISYVSNDALAVARQRSGTLQSSGAKGLRRRRKHDDKNCIVS